MATSRTVRYIRYNSNNATIHNGSTGVNSDGDVGSYQEPTFVAYDRQTLGSGVAWNIATQKVTLTNSNPNSQTFRVRFTNDTPLAAGSPNYGHGSNPTSMLIGYRNIPTSRVAAYAQTIPYYVRTFTENASGSFTYNIEIKLAPGFWNGSPTNINPVTYNRTQINSSGNVFRGEKFVPSRGTLYHSGSDFDFDGHINPSGVSNIGTFNHYGGEDGFGFSDFLPTYDNGGNGLDDGTAWAEIKITTSGSGGYGVTFYANPILEFDHLQTTRSTVLFYQARDIVMDGSDADHTIPTLTTTSTIETQPNSNHFLDDLTLASTATLDEDTFNKKICPQTDFTSSTTFEITPSVKKGIPDTEYTTSSLMLVTTANFTLLDEETLTASTTFAITPSFKPGIQENFVSTATATTDAGLIYDITGDYIWDSFNLNTYFEVGYSEDNFALEEGEYTWDFLASTAWADWPVTTWLGNEQTWDNWPNDVWETPYTLPSTTSITAIPTFLLGDVVTYTGSFSLAEDSAFNIPAESNATASTTLEATAQGLISVTVELSGAFSPSLEANITYDLQEDEISITGAFSPILTASAITDTFADIDVTASISITPTFKPGGQSAISAATELDLSPTFKPAGLAALTALASTLTVGRLVVQADPFNTVKISQENRVVLVPVENRQTLVMEENRVNIVGAESRAFRVPQETRRLKLRIPPYSNRLSTPRVRSEQ